MMYRVHIDPPGVMAKWRDAARALLAADIHPDAMIWKGTGSSSELFDDIATSLPPEPVGELRVPKAFVSLARSVICHSDPERFALLYGLLWKIRRKPGLMGDISEPLVSRLYDMQKSVRRDCHKMKAFVRFREIAPACPEDGVVPDPARRRFGAWFEPDHYIVERTAPFFARRFGDMDWIIATPQQVAHFESGNLRYAPGGARPDFGDDATDDLWRTYFTNIFNPARLKVKAMQSEMPKKYWKNLPEAQLIPGMIAGAEKRLRDMRNAQPTQAPMRSEKVKAMLPERETFGDSDIPANLEQARKAIQGCTRCELYCHATQAVFGEGPADARILFVGEQPGDREDLAGKPFVGPAGQVFDDAMESAGLVRGDHFITNAVKHFKFEPRGTRRIHRSPDRGEIAACKFWLDQERRFVAPDLVVAMGATAAGALTGEPKGIMKRRGSIETLADGTPVFLTVHPSSILRMPDANLAAQARADFHRDIAFVARYMQSETAPAH